MDDDSVFDDGGSSDFVPEPAPVSDIYHVNGAQTHADGVAYLETQGQSSPEESCGRLQGCAKEDDPNHSDRKTKGHGLQEASEA